MSTTSMENPQCSLPENHEGEHQPETDRLNHKCVGMYCMWCDNQCKYELVTFQTWHGEEKGMPDIELNADDTTVTMFHSCMKCGQEWYSDIISAERHPCGRIQKEIDEAIEDNYESHWRDFAQDILEAIQREAEDE